ncbi:hypothetical protein BHS06_17030 [Myxococcus xanthus]|uniref:PDZ domain-containing protein n=1 Tax=Myxococcus xanthus TaxID=34 RepID=UPI00112B14B0|nr:PDZ domain-containing protein [Myxococcus xanthus]QDE90528.1 hypothetical protein BHS06_17030 [Myxococcus xanthus]
MRTTLQWVSTLGGVLTLIFFGLDRFKRIHVPPKVIVGLLLFTFVAAVGLAITEKPKPEVEGSRAVLHEELEVNLQQLAGFIHFTAAQAPGRTTIPRRPGETREQFEDRARDEFAHNIEFFLTGAQQFALRDSVHASQGANIAAYPEAQRHAAMRAYLAVDEVRNRVFLYRDGLRALMKSHPNDAELRERRAELSTRMTVNELQGLWFDILGQWLLLEPERHTAQTVASVVLPQILPDGPPATLEPGVEGWRFAHAQRARVAREKAALLKEDEGLRGQEREDEARRIEAAPESAQDAVAKAGLAYMEGRAEDAERHLDAALRFEGLSEEQRRFVETSRDFLDDPDDFNGQGVYLMGVEPGGAAAQAGLKPGDVVLRYGQAVVKEPAELSHAVAVARGAPNVEVEVLRDRQRRTFYVQGGVSLSATGSPLVVLASAAL